MELNSNRLSRETSPYLLQHQHNPVDWYPWGQESLEKARAENKPIFLSIGYSACHWCHVMAHESFENKDIARKMNQLFINIKVDREERPDVDSVYMKAVIALLGHGGWPISLFLTPDQKPYFGGTYYPPSPKHNRLGFLQILNQASALFHENKGQVDVRAGKILQNLQMRSQFEDSQHDLDAKMIDRSIKIMAERFDNLYGGFGMGMKFPEPMNFALTLRHWRRFVSQESMEILDKSLTRMAQGGIYDHLGGGFHRYATDREWRVPHFEKMLYDNALISKLFLETFQATKQDMYREVSCETFDYILREMTSPEGYFYSSQDADTEGHEGEYYVWELKEVLNLLGPRHSKVFARAFGLSSTGNFNRQRNVLHLKESMETISEAEGLPIFEVNHIIQNGKKVLLEAREKRKRPRRDEKMITAWNGLMISALATGHAVIHKKKYLETAGRCADFIHENLWTEKGLLRIWKDGQAKISGYMEDYAYLIESLLALYEASFDLKWILRAEALADRMIELFWDSDEGGFFIYGSNHETLIHRPKNPQDEAIPSANGVAALSLLKLGRLTGKEAYWKKGEETLKAFQYLLEKQPASVNGLLSALDYYLDTPTEIVFCGARSSPDFLELFRMAQRDFRPNKVMVFSDEESRETLPLATGKKILQGKPTVYLCQNGTCLPPIQSGESLENQLEPPPMIKINIFDDEKKRQEMQREQNQNFLDTMSLIFKKSGFDKR